MLFTETQLQAADGDTQIGTNLLTFDVIKQDSTDRYLSLAVCLRNTIHMIDVVYFSTVNALSFVLCSSKSENRKSVLLLYREHGSSVQNFLQNLQRIITTIPIDIILGDFNINYVDDNEAKELHNSMQTLQYVQIVKSPT